MRTYIPEDLFIDSGNKEKVSKILKSVPDTDLRFPGIKTMEDAIEEIRALGESRIVDFLSE